MEVTRYQRNQTYTTLRLVKTLVGTLVVLCTALLTPMLSYSQCAPNGVEPSTVAVTPTSTDKTVASNQGVGKGSERYYTGFVGGVYYTVSVSNPGNIQSCIQAHFYNGSTAVGSWFNIASSTTQKAPANTDRLRVRTTANGSTWSTTSSLLTYRESLPYGICDYTFDHGGANYTISSSGTYTGKHINVGTFTVNSGVTATVAQGCSFEVSATNVTVSGTINADGKGYLGGGTGGNAGSYSGAGSFMCTDKNNCAALIVYGGGAGSAGGGTGGGNSGAAGGNGYGKKQQCFDWDDEGGRCGGAGGGGGGGGGSYGGSGSSGGNGGSGGASSACRESGCAYAYSVGGGGSGGGVKSTYGTTSGYDIAMGSGGAAAGGGGRGFGGGASGGVGGSGGGMIQLVASNAMTITGTLTANGTNASGNGGGGGISGETGECCNDLSGGCDERTRTGAGGGGGGAGGGSGGGILLRADGMMNIGGATLNAKGGNGTAGGSGGSSGGSSGSYGGKGGGGRIKVFYNPCLSNTLNPTRSVAAGVTGNGTASNGTYAETPYAIVGGGSVPNGAYVWNGLSSIAWTTPANWSHLSGNTWTTGTQPGAGAVVIIPGPPCTPRNPTISTNVGAIKSLEIHSDDGAVLTITCSNCLEITD